MALSSRPSSPDRTAPRLAAWPLQVAGTWALAWALFVALRQAGAALGPALAGGAALGAGLAWASGRRGWRRGLLAAGFPVSAALAATVAGTLPAWAWLLPAAGLLLLYPPRAWRDAPLFPTPAGALAGLARRVPLAPGASVLEAGCGLGDGLQALRSAYPQARLLGLEWSWPLAGLCAWRLRHDAAVQVRRGDLWAAPWGEHDLVYLFQRPESLPRAWAKAQAEMAPGGWLVSLEFELPGRVPDLHLQAPGGKPVWGYRVTAPSAAAPAASPGVTRPAAPPPRTARPAGPGTAPPKRRRALPSGR